MTEENLYNVHKWVSLEAAPLTTHTKTGPWSFLLDMQHSVSLITSSIPMGDFPCVMVAHQWVFFGEVSGSNTWPV